MDQKGLKIEDQNYSANKRNKPTDSSEAGNKLDSNIGSISDCSNRPCKKPRLVEPLGLSNFVPTILQPRIFEDSAEEKIVKESNTPCHEEAVDAMHKEEISESHAAGRNEQETATKLPSYHVSNQQLGTKSVIVLQLNMLFYWILKAAEILRSSCNETQPSVMTNTDLTHVWKSIIDHMVWLGVFVDFQGVLNYSTLALQELLASISTICSKNPQISSTATSSANSTTAHPATSLNSNSERLLQFQSDNINFLNLPVVRQSTGEWSNPKFVEWLKSPHALFISIDRLQSSEPLIGYQLSGNHQINGSVLFVLGVVSMIFDLVEEYWARVRGVIAILRQSKSSDFFQKVKLLSNLPALKSCCNSDGVNFKQFYTEVNKLLRNNKLPKDLDAVSYPAFEGFATAYQDWEEIRQKDEQKKKVAEELKMAQRELERQNVLEREQHRRDVVEFLTEGFKLEKTFLHKNPFWVLGIDPLSATDELLKKVKQHLTKVLHPDKCSDPSSKTEANVIFLDFSISMDKAQRLLSEDRRNYIKANFPARAVAPYAKRLGLPTSSSSSTFQAQPAAASNIGANAHQTESVVAFRPSAFADFNLAINKTFQRSIPGITYSDGLFIDARFGKRHLLVRGRALPNHIIRMFVFRPSLAPDIQTLLKLDERSGKICEKYLNMCSAIFESKSNTFDSLLVKDREAYIQPADEFIRNRSHIFLAVHIFDTTKNEVAEVGWIRLQQPKFVMPIGKPPIIKMLQSFCDAPDEYEVKSILESKLCITFDVFPSVEQFSGCYPEKLKEALTALMQKAAKVEGDKV